MDSNLDEGHRRSIRLQNYDYRQPGLYFVTICTNGMQWAFGEIVDSEMRLSSKGQIVHETWSALPERFPDIELDQFVIMPNHLHGIISIVGEQFITSNDSYKSNVP